MTENERMLSEYKLANTMQTKEMDEVHYKCYKIQLQSYYNTL